MAGFTFQPLLVPFGMAGPTPEAVAEENADRAAGDFLVSSLDAQEGPRHLANSREFDRFLDEHPYVRAPEWAEVDNEAIAAYHGVTDDQTAGQNPGGLSVAAFTQMWGRRDADPEPISRFLDARAGTRLDPRQLWPGIEHALPGQPFFCRHLLHVLTMAEIVKDHVLQMLNAGITPIVIGGDHSVNLGTMAGVAVFLQRNPLPNHGVLDAFWVDAHADANTPLTSPSGNIHGMPVAALLGLGPDSPGARVLANLGGICPKVPHARKVTLVGLRDVDEEERELIDATNVDWYSAQDILATDGFNIDDIATRHVSKNRHGQTVFSLDLDGLDPTVAPSVTTNVAGGLSVDHIEEALRILRRIGGRDRIVAHEIHEFNPVRRSPRGRRTVTAAQNETTRATIVRMLEAMVAP